MSNTIKSVLLLATLTGLLVVMGQLIGGNAGMILAFGLAVVMNFASYWFSDQIALKMAGAREVSPEEAPAASRHRRGAGVPGRPPEAARRHRREPVAERLRDRPRPGPRRSSR